MNGGSAGEEKKNPSLAPQGTAKGVRCCFLTLTPCCSCQHPPRIPGLRADRSIVLPAGAGCEFPLLWRKEIMHRKKIYIYLFNEMYEGLYLSFNLIFSSLYRLMMFVHPRFDVKAAHVITH